VAQLVLELTHHRRGQLGKFHPSEIRRNVQIQVLPILIDGGALKFALLCGCKPQPTGRRDSDALTVSRMDAMPDLNLRGRREGISLLLLIESLEMALAVLVGVVDDPGFLRLSLPGRPNSLANRHGVASSL
jgi:hypothetical protein